VAAGEGPAVRAQLRHHGGQGGARGCRLLLSGLRSEVKFGRVFCRFLRYRKILWVEFCRLFKNLLMGLKGVGVGPIGGGGGGDL
jgi:hypothetical protein